jgi:hypothetical protein
MIKTTSTNKVFINKSETNFPSILDLNDFGLPVKCEYMWRGSEKIVYSTKTKVYKIIQRFEKETEEDFENKLKKIKSEILKTKEKIEKINNIGGIPIEYVMSKNTYDDIVSKTKILPFLPKNTIYFELFDGLYILYKLDHAETVFHENGIIEQTKIDDSKVLGSGFQHLKNSNVEKHGLSTTIDVNGSKFMVTGEIGKTIDYCEKLESCFRLIFGWETDSRIFGNFMFNETDKIVYVIDPTYINKIVNLT